MKFFQLIPSNTNINFIAKFHLFVIISLITCGAAVVAMFAKGFNFGIDFTGGSVVQIRFKQATDPETARKLVADAGAPDATVAALGKDNVDYLITTRTVAAEAKSGASLPQKILDKGGDRVTIQQVDVVGPKVGEELKMAALRSLFYSIVLITIYIWLRFDFRFAPGATIAMVHDIILAAGYYVLFGKEFNITAVAALLTIAGYSVNDTIVIDDRVRELLKRGGDSASMEDIINKAINMTLSRTMLTSGVTLLSIIPIAIFCTGEIKDFAEAMLVGIFVGTYSTVYVAAPLTVYVQHFIDRRNGKRKPAGKTVVA